MNSNRHLPEFGKFQTSGNCLIQGNCFASGDTRPSDRCSICRSSDNWEWNNGR